MESNLNDVLGNAFYAQEQEEAKSKQVEDLIKSYSGASALLPPRQYGKPINPEKFMSYLNKNIDPKKIFRNDHQRLYDLDDKYGSSDDWIWYYSIVDIKSGQLYGVYQEDDYLETIQPLFVEEYPAENKKYVFTSEKKNKNTLIINIDSYENGKLTLSSTEVYNLSKLTSSFVEDGKTYTDKCIYYPISDDVEIINSISR